jgi:hypothetical protein
MEHSIESLDLDLKELEHLLASASRDHTKKLLSNEIANLKKLLTLVIFFIFLIN